MSQHKLSFSTKGGCMERVLLDDVDISSAVRSVTLNALPGEIPTGMLEILPLISMDAEAAIAELSMIDTGEIVQLRQFLAESCDLCEKLLTMMTEEQITEVLKTRDTARQLRLWKVHADGPDADTSRRTYQEKVRRANGSDAASIPGDGPYRDED